MEIKEKLQEIFRDVFDDEDIAISEDTTSKDIEDWDSITHITLINEIEGQFNIRFTTEEMMKAKNVGEFIEIIDKKINH